MDLKIIFFLPNIIDYIRLLLLFSSIFTDKILFISLYISSSMLDAVDGYLERKLNQSSVLGKVLDIIIDRLSVRIICMKIYAKNIINKEYFMIYFLLDLIGGMVFFISKMYNEEDHKINKNAILVFYYKKEILTLFCLCSELYLVIKFAYPAKKGLFIEILNKITTLKALIHLLELFEGIKKLSSNKIK